ncbi:MAG: tetratricopeptide repeat protein [Gemmatimonadetes bacterium]|nr:tetratricopeptide repeat protein [Candidatus Palauibacter rhopaloidicola]
MTAGRTAGRRGGLAAIGLPAVLLALAATLAPASSTGSASAVGLATPQEAPAAAPADRFQAGNSRYQAGDHEGALEAWLGLHEDGFESGELHYNIGNAYFRLGELGRAILFYERAKVALPRDESVRVNLELARSLTADQITPLPGFWVPRVVRWAVQLVPRAWLIATLALGYLGLASILLYRLLSTGPPRWTRHAAVVAAALTFVVGTNLLIREFGVGRAERGVILQTEAAVQSAPSDDPSLQLFTIHEGAVVRIDRRSSDWLEIVLEDGKVGWVRAGDLETI